MKAKSLIAAVAMAGAVSVAHAQNEQFIPMAGYWVGPYASGGSGVFGGFIDYVNMINARDGGVNGVKLTYEKCETEYNNARGVECYERLKNKGPTGATVMHPLSTGITYSILEKATADKVPVISMGYGRTDAADGRVFPYIFPLITTYWNQASAMIKYIGTKEGGVDKLKGKKITLIYHDSAYGKEPHAVLQEDAKRYGYTLNMIPVAHPGNEQGAQWLQIRQQKPDWVILWGWGVMNSAALKEAVATGYPREKMYGVWWSGAEPDVKDVGQGAKGYNALTLHASGQQLKVMQDILQKVHDKGNGSGPRDEVGSVLYVRGMLMQMLAVEGVRRAQERFGKGKVMTSEQVRWGLENLALDSKRLEALGLADVMRPLATSCADHMGSAWARVQTWDGGKWNAASEFVQADEQIIKPLVKANADKYLSDKKMTRREAADCQS